jgi:hypothetical protein
VAYRASLAEVLDQHALEALDQSVCIAGIEGQRRPDLDDVVIWAVGA